MNFTRRVQTSIYRWVSPRDCKEIQAVHSEGDQPWDFFGRNDTKAESWLIGKASDAGRDWGWEEKGTTQDEMAGWHHGLDGRESEWTPGVGDGQGGLACCDSWGRKESDTTEPLNWPEDSDHKFIYYLFLLSNQGKGHLFSSSLKTISNPWNHFTISKKSCIFKTIYYNKKKNELN